MQQRSRNREASTINWVPQATLKVPISVLEKRCRLHFSDAWDDLDTYYGTEPLHVNGHEYVLRHYRGDPSNEVGIYLPFEVSDRDEIAEAVSAILTKLQVPPDEVTWQRVTDSPFLSSVGAARLANRERRNYETKPNKRAKSRVPRK